MKTEKKKIAAAISAVNQYLEEEQAEQALPKPAPLPVPSIWALSGRQEIMTGRAMVTSGLFKH